jgi:hypothetical protein
MSSIAVAKLNNNASQILMLDNIPTRAQDVFVTELVKTGKYTVVGSEPLKAKLAEMGLSLNSDMAPTAVAQVGQKIGIHDIVTGLFSEFGSVDSFLQVRVIRSSTGSVVWTGQSQKLPKVSSDAEFNQHIKPAIQQLVASLKAAV